MSSTYSYKCLSVEFLSEKCLRKVKKIIQNYSGILQLDIDNNKKPIASIVSIQFNGKWNNGADVFYWQPNQNTFFKCDTNNQEYDKAVQLVLLALKEEYGSFFLLSSTSSHAKWKKAIENCQEYGITVDIPVLFDCAEYYNNDHYDDYETTQDENYKPYNDYDESYKEEPYYDSTVRNTGYWDLDIY